MAHQSVARALVLLALLLLTTPSMAPAATVTVGSATVAVNDVFSIPISISGVGNLTSFQFDLAFDPLIVAALAVNEGTDFVGAAAASLGATVFTPGVIDNGTGLISLVADAMVGLLGPGLAPGGVLATIDFQALAPGVSPLTLSSAFLTEANEILSSVNGDFVVDHGQVIVRADATVPEAGTGVLVATGLAAIAAVTRKGRVRMRRAVISLLALIIVGAVAMPGGLARAETIANGPYYATPSWDQTMPPATRFIVLSNFDNQAVLDRETGLVWDRTPSAALLQWSSAFLHCTERAVGPRYGWRLPAIEELMTLISTFHIMGTLPLPPGHPFVLGTSDTFWSSTTDAFDSTKARLLTLVVSFPTAALDKTADLHAWCVRGGRGNESRSLRDCRT